MKTVTIPGSVTEIGSYAFHECSSLKSVNITDLAAWCKISFEDSYSTPLYYARHLYLNGEEVTDLTIPNNVNSIGNYAFYRCIGLSSVTIPNSVTKVSSSAFYGCSGLISLTLNCPQVDSWFSNRSSLTTVTIGQDVTNIVKGAFGGCQNLRTITLDSNPVASASYSPSSSLKNIFGSQVESFVMDENVRGIGDYAFSGCSALKSLKILGDELTSVATNALDGCNSCSVYVRKGTGSLLGMWAAGYVPYDITTEELLEAPGLEIQESTATTLKCDVVCPYKEYVYQLSFNDQPVGTSLYQSGLEPNQEYTVTLTIAQDKEEPFAFEIPVKVMTADLTFKTLQPKVVTEGNVIVESISNIQDDAENVGIEWRRIDWPDDFPSNSATVYLYNGTIQGYIRNMNTNYLWKFRSFYESASGNRYYSDWMGIDPTNTSYFEPTVHTYAQINVTGNTAEVKGYAMRGTDNVVSQGFMYWEGNTSVSLRRRAASVPDGAMVVKASGNIMTATLKDLEYETTYNYAAFVTTSEGETFYGEIQTFSTSADPDGIEGVEASEDAVEVARYDIQGRKIANPQKGINIIRYSDGSTRKVMIK